MHSDAAKNIKGFPLFWLEPISFFPISFLNVCLLGISLDGNNLFPRSVFRYESTSVWRVWRLIKWKYVCAVAHISHDWKKLWRSVWKEWRPEGEQGRGKESENERKRGEDWKEKGKEKEEK